jgi:hypothetical protein
MTCPEGMCVVMSVEVEGHCFVQHPDDLRIWVCLDCGNMWMIHPDRNPRRSFALDSQIMPRCPGRT